MQAAFDGNRSNLYESYLGSKPSTDGDWKSWAASVGEAPFPIEYTLDEVLILLIM